MTASPAKMRNPRSGLLASLLCASLCTAAAFGWQALKVRAEFHHNWTGLFDAGRDFPPPPALAHEHNLIVSPTTGYDGQFYHFVAHDPFLQHGFVNYVDVPRMRYGRILVPLAAWILAAGHPQWIDPAYHLVILLSVFLGAYWTSRRSALLVFLFLPATILSIETSTVDVALLAFCAGFVLLQDGPAWKLFPILALAPLVRETGLLLAAAAVLAALFRKQWQRAALFSAAALPWLAWTWFVRAHTVALPYPNAWIPLSEAWSAFWNLRNSVPGIGGTALTILERSGIAGSVLAIFTGLYQLRRPSPVALACALFALLGIFLQRPDVWVNYHAHTRVLSPLYLLLYLNCEGRPSGAVKLVLCLVLPRFLLNLFVQVPTLL